MENRNTRQRNLILEAINNCTFHPTAEEVYDLLNCKIGMATVYRNLNYLTEKKCIRKINLPNNKVVYDRMHNKHYHMQCDNCGIIIDISTECLDYLYDLDYIISKKTGNLVNGHDIMFTGLCENCSK